MLLLSFVLACLATGPMQTGYAEELKRLAVEDQADRQFKSKPSDEVLKAMREHDRMRQRRVREILRRAKDLDADELSEAALIFQHGGPAADFSLAHLLTIAACSKGKIESMPALTEDRFLRTIGKVQRFGTQFEWSGELDPVDEGETAITDELRLNYFVPPLQMSREKGLKAVMESGDLGFDHIKKRRDPKAPLVEDPEVARQLAEHKIPVVLALYRADKLVTDADYREAAKTLAGSSSPDYVILGHEFATLAFMEGDRASGPLSRDTWKHFLDLVGHREALPKYRCLDAAFKP